MTPPEINLSFEIFPPRSEDAERQLTRTLEQLTAFNPSFVSVTYGAGGSTRERTLATIDRIARHHPVPLAGHLTCLGQTCRETDAVIDEYRRKGIRHIVALRGDTPGDASATAVSGYANAAELTAAIRRRERPGENFEISVAAYPDIHPDSPSAAADLDNLAAKFDAGADRAISQFFFMNAPFLRLRDKLARRGIDKPLVAGLLPVHDFAQTRRFARRCRTRIPHYISRGFKHVADDAELTRMFAISLAVEQIDGLIAEGIRDFHFYTLNRAELAHAVCSLIGKNQRADTAAREPSFKLAAR